MSILAETADRVCTIRFNRPEKKNALTAAMYAALAEAIAAAEADPAVRVLLFAGDGASFTAGNDIMDFLQRPPSGDDSPVARFMRAMISLQKPAVAAVEGVAMGIGVTMLLQCDLVFAGEGTRLQMPFVNLGTCPELASSLILPAMMGHARAAELLMLGEPFDAATAREYGIVNRVCPRGETEAQARAAALRLAAQPPAALRTCKALLRRHARGAVEEAMQLEAKQFFAMLRGPEALEALGAFAQKRKPDFSRFG